MKLDASVSAVVTGGASGPGAATVRMFASHGVKVAIFDFDAAFAKARAAIGQERILVNCAGIGSAHKTAGRDRKTGAIARFPIDEFEKTIRVNTIMPGIFETPWLPGLPDTVRDALGAPVPLPKRLGKPAGYAAMVESVATNGYLNGESIRLDGAIRMAPR